MATQTIYTNKDVGVAEFTPDINSGGSDNILIWSDTGSTDVRRGYWGFDITSGPASIDITSVLLYLYQITWSNEPGNAYFKRTTSAWAENTITWNNQPTSTTTNQYTHNIPYTINTWHNYDVTNLYKDAKTAGNELGVLIQYVDESAGSPDYSSLWRTKEYSTGSLKAYLYIIYTINRYVKTTGDDAKDGLSWANAWKTVNKAATTVADGTTVHIGFGDYTAEPAGNKIAPQNVGATGITYHCETATTGGGTGTVSIEQNA